MRPYWTYSRFCFQHLKHLNIGMQAVIGPFQIADAMIHLEIPPASLKVQSVNLAPLARLGQICPLHTAI